MSQIFTNNAATVLASAKAAGATTMVVQAGTGARFPTLAAGDFFELTLFKIVDGLEAAYEIVKVTARSIDTFTIVGAQQGTAPTAFGVGDQVSLRVTAAWLNKATTDIESKAPIASPAFTGAPTAPTAGQLVNGSEITNAAWVNRRGQQFQPSPGVGLNTGTTALRQIDFGHWIQFNQPNAVLNVGADANAVAVLGVTFTVKAAHAGVINFAGVGVALPVSTNMAPSYTMRRGETATFTSNGPNGGWYVTADGVQPSMMDATYAPIDNPVFTGTVAGISKTMVGLGNVDNTSDVSKPVSTAQAAALALKADAAGVPATVKSNLTGYKEFAAVTSNRAIVAADIGKLHYVHQVDISVTLPRPDSIGALRGDKVSFITIKGGAAQATLTLTPTGSGTTLYGQTPLASLTLLTGQQVELVSDGISTWQVGMTTARMNDNAEIAAKAPINNATFTGTTKGTVFSGPAFFTGADGATQSSLRAPPAVGVAGAGNEVASMGVAGISGISYGGRYFWETIPAAQVSGGNLLYKQSYAMNLRATDTSDDDVTPAIITLRGNGQVEVPGIFSVGSYITVPTPVRQINDLSVPNTEWVNRRGQQFQPAQGVGLNTGTTALRQVDFGHWFQFNQPNAVLTVGADVNAVAVFGVTFTVKAPYVGVINFVGTGVALPSSAGMVNSYSMRIGETATFTSNGPNGGWYVTSMGVQPSMMDATYAPINNPTFTGTVTGVTKAMVGLGNVDNTSDASKPVSTAQAAALASGLASKADTTALTAGLATKAAINGDAAQNFDVASINGSFIGGMRNRIINGSFAVNQRGTTTTTADSIYITDMWRTALSSSVAGLISFGLTNNNVSVNGNAAAYAQTATAKPSLASADYVGLYTVVEGYNMADLMYGTAGAKAMTISFRAQVGVGTTICVAVRNGTYTRTYTVPVTLTAGTNSYSVTIPGDTAGTWSNTSGLGLSILFIYACGTSYYNSSPSSWTAGGLFGHSSVSNILDTNGRYATITDVQLEKGSTPTPFSCRSIAEELSMCQRYFEVGESPVSFINNLSGSVSDAYGEVVYKTTKRAVPTIATANWQYYSSGGPVNFAPSTASVTSNRFVFVGGSLTSWLGWAPGGTWAVSAEF